MREVQQMSGKDKQARAGTGESGDFQKSCCCFKGTSQMGRDGAGIHISLRSEVNRNSGYGGGPASMEATLAGVHRSPRPCPWSRA